MRWRSRKLLFAAVTAVAIAVVASDDVVEIAADKNARQVPRKLVVELSKTFLEECGARKLLVKLLQGSMEKFVTLLANRVGKRARRI